jgi:hypothetical protein
MKMLNHAKDKVSMVIKSWSFVGTIYEKCV